MTFRSYAQNFEDVLLWRALGHVERGCYLDIGAQHPRQDSVSRGFYERGWRGVHVEPAATFAALLRDDRPDETVVEAAVAGSAGPLVFFEIVETGLSTGVAEISELHRAAGFGITERAVETTPLDTLLDRFATGDLHWLKIDVEGMEADVLDSWRGSAVRPWIVVVEATYPLSQRDTSGDWEAGLLARDYDAVHFDGLNRYYIARERAALRPAFATPVNVFDDFVLAADHHLCVAVTAEVARDAIERVAVLEQSIDEARAVTEEARAEARAANVELRGMTIALAAERRAVEELRRLVRPEPPRREIPQVASLSALMALSDAAFVDAAYRAILARRADPTGRQHYLAQVRAGVAKIDIAADLSRSSEALGVAVKLPGLDSAVRRRRVERLPVIGGAIRWLNRSDGLGAGARRWRAVENRLSALHEDSIDTAAAVGDGAGIAARLRPVAMDPAATPALDAAFTPRAQAILHEFASARRAVEA